MNKEANNAKDVNRQRKDSNISVKEYWRKLYRILGVFLCKYEAWN